MSNPFEQLAKRQIVAPVKSRMKAAETRAQNKKTDEDTLLAKRYREWRKARRDDFLARHPAVQTLLASVDSPRFLSELEAWKDLPDGDRYTLINEIGMKIPFDDPLPGEPESTFDHAKRILRIR